MASIILGLELWAVRKIMQSFFYSPLVNNMGDQQQEQKSTWQTDDIEEHSQQGNRSREKGDETDVLRNTFSYTEHKIKSSDPKVITEDDFDAFESKKEVQDTVENCRKPNNHAEIGTSMTGYENRGAGASEDFSKDVKEYPEQVVYVQNIALDCGEQEIRWFFRNCGDIRRVHLLKDIQGQFAGIAFVRFASREGAQKAVSKNGMRYLDRRRVRVEFAAI